MPADTNMVLQASVTRTASLNSASVDLKTGTPPGGLVARILYSAAVQDSGDGVFTFSIEESSNDSNFYPVASSKEAIVTLTTSAQASEVFLRFFTKKRYVRLACTRSGSGVNPTITYQADIVSANP
jgi:hypothetical protein